MTKTSRHPCNNLYQRLGFLTTWPGLRTHIFIYAVQPFLVFPFLLLGATCLRGSVNAADFEFSCINVYHLDGSCSAADLPCNLKRTLVIHSS